VVQADAPRQSVQAECRHSEGMPPMPAEAESQPFVVGSGAGRASMLYVHGSLDALNGYTHQVPRTAPAASTAHSQEGSTAAAVPHPCNKLSPTATPQGAHGSPHAARLPRVLVAKSAEPRCFFRQQERWQGSCR